MVPPRRQQGYADAQITLSKMNKDGRGAPQDFALAHMWFNLAAAKSDKNGVSLGNDRAAKMTPDQIADAQRLAREWTAAHPKK